MYGSIDLKSQKTIEFKIYDSQIKITKVSGGTYRYTRIIPEDSASYKLISYSELLTYGARIEKLINNADTLEIFPDNWNNDPRKMYNHLMMRISNPVMLPPNSGGVFKARLLPDIAIYIKRSDTYSLLDIIHSPTYKLALYGSPESGIIARYYNVELNSQPSSYSGEYDPFSINAILNIANQSDRWVTVSRLVIPIQHLSIYMCGGEPPAIETIKASIRWSMAIGKAIATVELDNVPPCRNYSKIAPYAASYGKKTTYIMEEGL